MNTPLRPSRVVCILKFPSGEGGADVNHRDNGSHQATPFIIVIQSKRTDLVGPLVSSFFCASASKTG